MRAFSEMSLDARLAYGFHVAMVLLFVGGGQWLSDATSPAQAIEIQIGGALLLVSGLVAVSVLNRQAYGWRWPGATVQDAAKAAAYALLLAAFFFAATPMFPPTTPGAMAWYLAGAGFGLWSVLLSLKLVVYDQATFEAVCRGEAPAQAEPPLPVWQRRARAAFAVLFVLSWLMLLYWFYSYGAALHGAVTGPDPTHTEPLSANGRSVYLTLEEMRRLDAIKTAALIGLPVVAAIGAFLHFVAGVPIFTGKPEPEPT